MIAEESVPPLRPLAAEDVGGDVVAVARRLLGAQLRANGVTVRLTEVEAYAGDADPGSHAFRGPTSRNAPMFRAGGHLYVYAIYGRHRCVNIVTGAERSAAAVLLRAGSVVAGHELALARSGEPRHPLPAYRLASGPARLGRVLGLGLADSGADLLGPGAPLRVELAAPLAVADIGVGPRVGVSGPGGEGAAFPWRFWIAGDRTVSPYRPGRNTVR